MKNTSTKRILAMLLSVVMILGLYPVAAFAAGEEERTQRNPIRAGGETGGRPGRDGELPAVHGLGATLRGALRIAPRPVASPSLQATAFAETF